MDWAEERYVRLYVRYTGVDELLAAGEVQLLVAGDAPGVVAPERVRSGLTSLNIGYSMAVPFPDLRVSEEGVQGTLFYDREPYWTFIPWSARAPVRRSV